ncbi:3-dehydroquinate synthase [Kroppenstedtia pulmonis]|uniref:3-dehydroquinate synthase n=1 Tax=Kroppenstedtia pulmonis TaxID=1380685 RepID=A0A7D4BPS2_9BACL|nr:3-dehydroquinate synthase [Kroppenstedtia pulmonis]QKG84331.1 3-dehydroquinate synthase [Kroppenstedtia pulmonis]
MKKLTVRLPERSYPIYIGTGLYQQLPRLLDDLGWSHRPLMVVTDTQVGPLYGKAVIQPLEEAGFKVGLVTVPAGEVSKSLSSLEQLTETCIQFGLDRSGAVLALGGGVIGDLAGFLAATYMRGIPFVQLPTTLLAHDSSVGGKVGVNHALGKNMIGAFHQPSLVVFDVDTLHTLPEREVSSGFAEVIKHALIRDTTFVDWLADHRSQLLSLESDSLGQAIMKGCRVKAEIVAQDERESGLRAVLNYGHTIGHALESVSGYGCYTHGEAVAIGMVGAAMLGEQLGLATGVLAPTEKLLKSFRLPIRFMEKLSDEALLNAMKRDKKVRQGGYTFVLPTSVGSVRILRDVEERAILQVLQQLRGDTR